MQTPGSSWVSTYRRPTWTWRSAVRTEAVTVPQFRGGHRRAARVGSQESHPRLVVMEATGGFEVPAAAALAAAGRSPS